MNRGSRRRPAKRRPPKRAIREPLTREQAAQSLLREELGKVIERLGEDELRVFLLLAHRVAKGAHRYGRLYLGGDERDFLAEGLEELVDGLFYLSAQTLRCRR